MKKRSGMTLIELLISIFILSVGVLAAIGSFRYIGQSVLMSKTRTLATNMAQEQIEKLKNLDYYTLLVTSSPYSDSRFSPPITYDTGHYPLQTIVEGGISFFRATRVEFAYQNGAVISVAPWTADDTALKQVTVYVIWREKGEWRYHQTQSLFANPAASPLNATAAGTVKTPANVPIAGALVQVIDNPNWFGYADSAGAYRFSVSEGSYTIQASSHGYYTASTPGYQSFTSGQTTTVNFTLTAIASNTVTGYVYRNDHLLISHVVVSTGTLGEIEYVELFNPTTSPVNIGSGASADIGFYIFGHNDQTKPDSGFQPVPLVYVSTYVPSYHYYLIANTSSSFTIQGAARTADAYYNGYLGTHIFDIDNAGGVGIATPAVEKIDAVSWSKNSTGTPCPDTPEEGSCVSIFDGMGLNDAIYRLTSPASFHTWHGRAYDTDDNSVNFLTSTPFTPPNNVAQGVRDPVTGTPAYGSVVKMNDRLNNNTSCSATTIGGVYPTCQFALVAATGTWTLDISSAGLFAQIDNVTVANTGVSTSVPNGATSPDWTMTGYYSNTILKNTTHYAFVSGYVTRSNGTPLSGIKVNDGNGRSATTSSTGFYSLLSTTGSIQLTGNPNDGTMNRAYTTQARPSETLESGGVYANRDFSLELSGIIRGYFQTSSNTPLPSRVAYAEKASGTDSAQAASDNTGYFYLQNLSTGTYTVTPQLDSMESASPISLTVTLTSTGTATIVSSFTITTGLAEITGQVLTAASTATITTGVLVVASTAAITGALPPPQNGSTGATCSPCYYMTSSDATGVYSLQVRSSSSTYYVYGWKSSVSGTSATVSKSPTYSVSVTQPGQIATQNLSW